LQASPEAQKYDNKTLFYKADSCKPLLDALGFPHGLHARNISVLLDYFSSNIFIFHAHVYVHEQKNFSLSKNFRKTELEFGGFL